VVMMMMEEEAGLLRVVCLWLSRLACLVEMDCVVVRGTAAGVTLKLNGRKNLDELHVTSHCHSSVRIFVRPQATP